MRNTQILTAANTKKMEKRIHHFAGSFELHLTVSLTANKINIFKERCLALDAKAIIIELEKGQTTIQPMLCKRIAGNPNEVVQEIIEIISALSSDYDISRIKIEASLHNKNIPIEDDPTLPSDCYFEHHVKMRLPKANDTEQLRSDLKHYNAHLSRNAFKTFSEDEERFATQRIKKLGLQNATSQFKALESFLIEKNITLIKAIKEFNIFDSNIELDAGWMAE